MPILGRLNQYASILTREFDETTSNNPSITGFGTYYASEFSENVGIGTTLFANVFAPYDPVYDEFAGVLYGPGQGTFMRQYTNKSVIVYNEIDEVTDFVNTGIVTTGLVFNLDAGNVKSYAGGTTWYDLSGNAKNGTLTSGAIYSSTADGSIVFDGSASYVKVALPVTSSYTTFTYSAWVYATNLTSYRTIIDQQNDSWFFGCNIGQIISFNPTFNTGYTISTNTWYNLVMAHTNAGPVRFYVNGSLVYTSANDSTSSSFSNFVIGAGLVGASPNEIWVGNIAQVLVYNTELSSTQVLQNYNALRSRFGL